MTLNLKTYDRVIATLERKGKGKRRPSWTPFEFTYLPGKITKIFQKVIVPNKKSREIRTCPTRIITRPTKRLIPQMRDGLWPDAGVYLGLLQLMK